MTSEQTQAAVWFVVSLAAVITGVRTVWHAWSADRRRRRNHENGVRRMLTTARLHRTALGAVAAIAAFLIIPAYYLLDGEAETRMRWTGTLFLIMSAFWAARNIVEDLDDALIEQQVREQDRGH